MLEISLCNSIVQKEKRTDFMYILSLRLLEEWISFCSDSTVVMPMKIIGFGLLEFYEVHFKDPPAYTVYFA